MRDESVVLRLAREVGSPDVLQMLYLHACADLAAVGPGVLNDWKLELLTELYYRTRRHLTGEDASQSTAQEVHAHRAAVQELLVGQEDQAWWTKQVEALPAGYLLTVSPPGWWKCWAGCVDWHPPMSPRGAAMFPSAKCARTWWVPTSP